MAFESGYQLHIGIWWCIYSVSVSHVIELATCWWKWSIEKVCDEHTKYVCFQINGGNMYHERIVQLACIGKQIDRTPPSIKFSSFQSVHYELQAFWFTMSNTPHAQAY